MWGFIEFIDQLEILCNFKKIYWFAGVSDMKILTQISTGGAYEKAKLVGDKEIWSTNIDIKSIQCKVVLYGLVGTKKEINKAIAQAKSVEGVRGVKSFLKSTK